MITYSLGFVLLLVGSLAMALQRLYSSIPSRELKRLAGRGDALAKRLYRVAAYGTSLRVLLWIVLGVALPMSFMLLIPSLPAVAAFALLVVASGLLFVWLPSLQLTVRSAQFAAWFVPTLAWILSRTHTFLDRIASIIGSRRELDSHSRLYEKEDLQGLLDLQKEQADNRIKPEELDLVQRALAFADRQAADILQPRHTAHLVNADDAIGPILLNKLHQSRQNSFLVYKDNEENIVGSLAMSDAVKARQGGRVLDLVRSDLIFVHEDFSLRDVLVAFQKTSHQVAVVINSFEEFTGLITFDQLVGELLGDNHDDTDIAYENRSAVAAFQPQKEQQTTGDTIEASNQTEEAIESDTSSPESTEVVK